MTQVKTAEHGTRSYYVNRRCRCESCTEANRAYQASLKGRTPRQHGTESACLNYGCRCEPCRLAGSMHSRRRRLNRQRREAS